MSPGAAAAVSTGTTSLVSKASDGGTADQSSSNAAMSEDGAFVAFSSYASNLVAGDTNDDLDVFVRHRQTGATTRVSVASDGTQANGVSLYADISADGNIVAFVSGASNLVPNDVNNTADVFVHDRASGTTSLVSVSATGVPAQSASGSPSVSPDGRYIAFDSLAPLTPDDVDTFDEFGRLRSTRDVYVHDRQTRSVTRASVPTMGVGTGGGGQPDISRDGRFVAFESSADNLVDGDTNDETDVFVRDRHSAATTRVSTATGGPEGDRASGAATISDDGRYVAFESSAQNLVTGDTNNSGDVFVHDSDTATTTRVSVGSGGMEANGASFDADISGDGRYVAFFSRASNLVSDDTNTQGDAFVHDRVAQITTRVSRSSHGTQAHGGLGQVDISSDGRYVGFTSQAWSLVPGDTNMTNDVFVHDRYGVPGPAPVLVSAGDATVVEGDGGTRAAVVTVSLSKPAATTVNVHYATAGGGPGPGEFGPPADADTDYTAKAGNLSFAPGVTSLAVKVPVRGDKADESDELFTLALSSPRGAKLSDAFGVGRIVDDDPPVALGNRLSIGDAAVHEGEAGSRAAVFTVSLTKPAASTVTVNYATIAGTAADGSDYVGKSGTLSIAAGASSAVVKVVINADDSPEAPREAFTLALSGSSGPVIADDAGVGSIVDDD